MFEWAHKIKPTTINCSALSSTNVTAYALNSPLLNYGFVTKHD